MLGGRAFCVLEWVPELEKELALGGSLATER